MISGISGSSSTYDLSGFASKLLKRLDTNGDGGIDVSELQAVAAGSNVDSSELFTSLDANADGSVDPAELESVLRKIAGDQQGHHPPKAHNGMQRPDPSEMFAAADTNGDGVIGKDEFAAMAPPDADASMTDEIFASIDTDGNGSIDEAENGVAMQRLGPPPPPQGSDGTAGTSALQTEESSANDMLTKLFEALQKSDDTDDNDKTLQSIAQLVDDLQNGTTYGRLGSLAMSMSGTRNLFSASA